MDGTRIITLRHEAETAAPGHRKRTSPGDVRHCRRAGGWRATDPVLDPEKFYLISVLPSHTHNEVTNPLFDPHDQSMRLELLFEAEQITDGRLPVCLLGAPALSA